MLSASPWTPTCTQSWWKKRTVYQEETNCRLFIHGRSLFLHWGDSMDQCILSSRKQSVNLTFSFAHLWQSLNIGLLQDFITPSLYSPTRTDLVGVEGGRGESSSEGLVKPPKLKKIWHHHKVTWPQNARNTVSKDLNFKHFLGEDAPRIPTGVSCQPTSLNFCTHTQLPSPFLLNIYWFDTPCVLQKRKNLSRAGIAGGMGTVALTPLPLHLFLAWFCFKLRLTIFKWSLCCGHMKYLIQFLVSEFSVSAPTSHHHIWYSKCYSHLHA